jgi:hypothetical protein
MPTAYAFPIDRLLTLGEGPARADEWPDYRAFDLRAEHGPDLIRMATDTQLHDADDPEAWGPLHAWRALGQLGVASAAEPLTGLLQLIDGDSWVADWVAEELPAVFALIGRAAVPVLARYLDDRGRGAFAGAAAAEALARIGREDPDARAECVLALQGNLEHHATQDRSLNAFLVSALLDLQASEAAPALERAFAAGQVDRSVAGDWEDVQVALGLIAERRTPRPNYLVEEGWLQPPERPESPRPEGGHGAGAKDRAKAKAKRKLAKQSRRRNRRRR